VEYGSLSAKIDVRTYDSVERDAFWGLWEADWPAGWEHMSGLLSDLTVTELRLVETE